jgi:hypothetical protein
MLLRGDADNGGGDDDDDDACSTVTYYGLEKGASFATEIGEEANNLTKAMLAE